MPMSNGGDTIHRRYSSATQSMCSFCVLSRIWLEPKSNYSDWRLWRSWTLRFWSTKTLSSNPFMRQRASSLSSVICPGQRFHGPPPFICMQLFMKSSVATLGLNSLYDPQLSLTKAPNIHPKALSLNVSTSIFPRIYLFLIKYWS